MKTFNFLSCMALFAIIGFSSCKDEAVVTSSVTVITKDSATITGYVTADLNLQTFGLEAVPEGTTLLVSVKYSDLNPAASSTAGSWQKSVIVTNGKYTVKVPTTTKGVTVKIIPSSFEADQTQVLGSQVSNVLCTYTVASASILSVVPNQLLTQPDFSYSCTLPATYTEKVTISGIAQAELDASNIGLDNLPNGTKIYFSTFSNFSNPNADWNDSITVQNGKFSINVPKGLLVNWEVKKFTYLKNIWVPNLDPTLSEYQTVSTEYSIIGSGTYSANKADVSVSTAGGTNPDVWIATTLSGTAKAELDGTSLGLENLPNGSKLYFSTSTWGASATVTNGSFSINVPLSTSINVYYLASLNQKSSGGVITSHNFQINTSFFSASTKTSTQPFTAY